MARAGESIDLVDAFGRGVLHDGRPDQEQRGASGVAARVGQLALRIVLPETCAGCGLSGTWMCRTCAASLSVIDQSSVCERCGYPGRVGTKCSRCEHWTNSLSACRSPFAFAGAARAAIHLLKYRNQPARAEWCARQMTEQLQLAHWQIDLFVPVPLHASRVRVRGYNQAERIAVELSRQTGIPTVAALRRVRPTVSQVGLAAGERRANVRDAFAAVGSLTGLNIALVDDVVTTGSTLQESARACVDAGAHWVGAATFAAELFADNRS